MSINKIHPSMIATTYSNANVAVSSKVGYRASTGKFTVTTS